MSDYPRDLVNKEGKVQEFKRIEDVPPGWFVRDTGEEVNPAEALPVMTQDDYATKPKKKAKLADVASPAEEPEAE